MLFTQKLFRREVTLYKNTRCESLKRGSNVLIFIFGFEIVQFITSFFLRNILRYIVL